MGNGEAWAGKRFILAKEEKRARGLALSGLPHIQVNNGSPIIYLPFAQASRLIV